MKLSVVIPAYNEERSIADVLGRTLRACSSLPTKIPGVDGFEVIVVNDGSQDGTRGVVEEFTGVRLIDHSRNRGYGAALKTGFAVAQGDYLSFLDADGTYPPESLPDLLQAALETGADMVVGSRMGEARSGMPLLRRVGNAMFAMLLSWIVKARITDTASGMRVFKKSVLDQLKPLPDGLDLTPAMSTIAFHEGLKVVEVPIRYDERVGQSKLTLVNDSVRFLNTILGLAETYNPLKFFGLAGLLLLGLAFLLGIQPVVYYLQYRHMPLSQVYRLLTILVLAVTGLNAVTFGIAANYVISLVRGKPQPETLLSKLFQSRLLKRLSLLGLLFMSAAVFLNAPAIYRYVTTLHVGTHWSYTLTGAFLFLVGAHLIMISRLVRVFGLLSTNVGFER